MTIHTLPVPAQQQAAPATFAPAQRGAGPLSLSQMAPQEAWKFAEALAGTPLLPDAYRKQPASILWAMEYGRALGLDVVTTITTIHVIKGKPTQSADLMLSRARQAGHRVRIKAERTRCVVTIMRADDPEDETEIEWTLDDAVTARLCELRNGKTYARDQKNQPTSWEKYPRAMLRSRAIAEAVRTACPEVLHGAIYTPEELGAVVDQDGNTVADAPAAPQYIDAVVVEQSQAPAVSEPPAPDRDWIAEAHAAADAAAVRRLYEEAAQAGAPAEVGQQLAEIGSTKPGAKQPQGRDAVTEVPGAPEDIARRDPAGPTPHSLADARDEQYEVDAGRPEMETRAAPLLIDPAVADDGHRAVDPEDVAHAEAENALRLAASNANLPELDATFERVVGLPISEAPAAKLDEIRQQIEAAAQGGQR